MFLLLRILQLGTGCDMGRGVSVARLRLFKDGLSLIGRFCEVNGLEIPRVSDREPQRWRLGACAFYRPVHIQICLTRCALPGYAHRAWSWPGYVIDRTPYGVLAHELGHHVDFHKSDERGAYFGDFSRKLRRATGEDKLTNYCPNDAEWFAEIFRLFVTNPDLLRMLRIKTYAALRDVFTPVVNESWEVVLQDAPTRTVEQARKKIAQALGV